MCFPDEPMVQISEEAMNLDRFQPPSPTMPRREVDPDQYDDDPDYETSNRDKNAVRLEGVGEFSVATTHGESAERNVRGETVS